MSLTNIVTSGAEQMGAVWRPLKAVRSWSTSTPWNCRQTKTHHQAANQQLTCTRPIPAAFKSHSNYYFNHHSWVWARCFM